MDRLQVSGPLVHESLVLSPTWDSMQRLLSTSNPEQRESITTQMEELVQTVQAVTNPESTYAATQLLPLTSPSSSESIALSCPTSSPMAAPDTGILSSYKLASQKIADLTRISPPCKMACTYHLQLSGTKTQIRVQKTEIPSEVPRNERVTLPPQVVTAPPPSSSPVRSSSKTFSCTPLLCMKRLSFTSSLSHKPSPISRNSSSDRSFISSKWKASFTKVSPQPQSKKPFRPWNATPKKSSWGQSARTSKSASVVQQPSTTSSKQKPVITPLCSSTPVGQNRPPLPTVFNSTCSQFYSSMVSGSCKDPDGIRERTRHSNILTLNEPEEGDNDFSQEIWDSRECGSPTIPPPSYIPETTPSLDSTKRKQFCSKKHLPPKKRFSDNFSESSVSMVPKVSPQKKSDVSPGASKKPTARKHRSKNLGMWSYLGSTFTIGGTSRTSRAREPIKRVSPREETIVQLEELLKVFMSSKKTSSVLMLHPSKQKLLIDYAHLCYITAVRSPGGVRLRKTSASRAPILMDKDWMLS